MAVLIGGATMTDPERRAYNAGLEAAGEMIVEMRTAMRKHVREPSMPCQGVWGSITSEK